MTRLRMRDRVASSTGEPCASQYEKPFPLRVLANPGPSGVLRRNRMSTLRLKMLCPLRFPTAFRTNIAELHRRNCTD